MGPLLNSLSCQIGSLTKIMFLRLGCSSETKKCSDVNFSSFKKKLVDFLMKAILFICFVIMFQFWFCYRLLFSSMGKKLLCRLIAMQSKMNYVKNHPSQKINGTNGTNGMIVINVLFHYLLASFIHNSLKPIIFTENC